MAGAIIKYYGDLIAKTLTNMVGGCGADSPAAAVAAAAVAAAAVYAAVAAAAFGDDEFAASAAIGTAGDGWESLSE